MPFGQWFTLEIVADGPHVIIKVNDSITADHVDEEFTSRVGKVALQVFDAATILKFRKIEIKELPPTKAPAIAEPAGQAGVVLPRKVFRKTLIRKGNQPVAGNGSWSIEGEELIQASAIMEGHWSTSYPSLVFGNVTWSSYDLTLKGKWEEGSQGFGIVFHWLNPNNHYFLNLGNYGNSGSELCFIHEGHWDRKPGMYRAGAIRRGEWYDVRIEVRGDQFRCFLDSELLFRSQDERFNSGLVGFRTGGCASRFREIKVTAPDGTLLWNGLPELPGEPAQ